MSSTQRPTVVWRITDGKKGHEKQTQALVQGLKAFPTCSIEEFTVPCKFTFSTCENLPSPDLILGAGHATHIPMLLCKLLFGGKTVLLMKPTIPAILFDLVLVPHHDDCTSFGNVEFTEGVLSPSIENRPNPKCGVILLGGTNRHFDWNTADIIRKIQAIADRDPGKQWTVCDSPRTPVDCLAAIEPQANIVKKPWQETNETFLTELLAGSSATWVTCDSVSMLYEALATRAQVGVLMLASNVTSAHPNKLLRGITKLNAARRVHLSTSGYDLEQADLVPLTDSEVQRCATIVARQLLSN